MAKTKLSSPNLAADYYLGNFKFLLNWVWQRYSDLLNHDEQQFIATFKELTHDSQCLFVRLSSRKGTMFRRNKLRYAEISSIDHAGQALIKSGLLCDDIPLNLQELADLLTKEELIQLFEYQRSGMKQQRKDDIIRCLGQQFPQAATWAQWTGDAQRGTPLGGIYCIHNQTTIKTLLLLFFGNAYQDLTEFVLQDLGVFRYENYPVDEQHRLFKNRKALEQYQQLVHLREQLEQTNSSDKLVELASQMPNCCANDQLERRRARLCNQLAYKLERVKKYTAALQLYTQSHLPPARERRVRLLEKQGDYSQAWTLLNEVLTDPKTEQEHQVAQRIAPRLAKKLGLAAATRPPSRLIEKHLTLKPIQNDAGKWVRVEEVVRQHLHEADAICVFAENFLLNGLLGLWLWPEMFRGINGAFTNPFQSAPLDMYHENFVSSRPQIDSLWHLFESDAYKHHISSVWQEKFGIHNQWVNWTLLTKDILEIALESIPAKDLKSIFSRMLFDLKNNRSGLPDLIQFFPKQNSYRMIEVKGPGDRPQDNQLRWLTFFSEHDIPAEIIYVRWH